MSLKRDNWNFFVGDPRYRTTFYLRFLDPSIRQLYDKHNLETSVYSTRCILVVICAVILYGFSEGILQGLFVTIVAVASLIGTLTPNTIRSIFYPVDFLTTILGRKVLIVSHHAPCNLHSYLGPVTNLVELQAEFLGLFDTSSRLVECIYKIHRCHDLLWATYTHE